jgi:beta-fructofuranosidase
MPLREQDAGLNRRSFITAALAGGLAASGLPELAAAAVTPSGGSPAANGSATPEWIRKLEFQPPARAGFTRVFNPSQGEKEAWYINDHCFIREDSGPWHLFGITGREPAVPSHEKFLLHATASHLLGPWTKHAAVMHVDPAAGETVVWAPNVLRHDGLYWMFYCGGGPSDAKYRIQLATSPDLWTWTRSPANPLLVDGYDARDPMVLRVGEQWVLYYCATESPTGGHHVVKAMTSSDLTHWTTRRIVFQSPQVGTFGGPTESPFVVARNGRYYLFLCTNAPYNNTDVYVSDSPFHWNAEDVVLRFGAHAAEVVDDGNGDWFVSSAGWGQGGLYLSDLTWTD